MKEKGHSKGELTSVVQVNGGIWNLIDGNCKDKDVSVYASTARQTDYSGLPPAYTFVCTAEPFYCETMTFIDNLKKAGIEAVVDVYEGLYHAFDMNSPRLDISKEAIERFNERFVYAKEHYFAEQA
jgi:acetyl esterase/lipase